MRNEKYSFFVIIERTTNEFVIRFPFTADRERMQDVIDYLRYRELTADYSVAQSKVDALAQAINRKWEEYRLDHKSEWTEDIKKCQ